MKFDDLPSAWQKENKQSLSPEVRDAMIVRVSRRVERIGGKILRRDLIETIAAIFVIFSFGWMVISLDTVVARIGAGFVVLWAVFIIWKLHRTRMIQRPAPIDAPVHEFCRIELERMDRQIQLLRSVLWWYIAPAIIGANIVFIGTAGFGVDSRAYLVATLLLAWGIYALNMRAVAKSLVPPREELANLLSQLEDTGPNASVPEKYPPSPTEQPKERSSRLRRILSAVVVIAALGYITSVVVEGATEYPKRAPFTGVRWEGDKPVVKIGEEWSTLVSLDGIAADDIVASSRWIYGYKWRKRFEEDLVELLTRMGHPPQDKVTLVVQSRASSVMRTFEGVPMTEANRLAVFRDALARERAKAPFADLIVDLRKESNLVGLAAMVIVDGKVIASAVDGERKMGSGVRLEIGDRWHLGGITKSITATMIARLIESGQMHWSDTVGKVFPEASVHEDWKPVTLGQLLTDTAGAPASFPRAVRRERPALGTECTQARREAVLNVLAQKPETPPGKKFEYSNVGYVIAGAMAEKVTGATWEDLVKREVFEPLKLTESGFGPPKSADETLEQPRGHRGKVAMDDTADNTPIMGPAGTVHMTLPNLCTFAREHMLGQLGTGKILSAETYKRLHTPELDGYACGWVRNEPNADIPHTEYWHNGSNTMWYALIVFIPEENMVVAVTSNDGDSVQAEMAAVEIVKASVKKFNAVPDPPRRELVEGSGYPRKSPFAGVRWEGDKPVVKIGEEWFTLVSLDGIAIADIVAFSRRTYANKWQIRFEEDLIEVLTKMGHAPKDTVRLIVSPLGSQAARTLEHVPMTEANRRAIYDAARARERGAQKPTTQKSTTPIKDAKTPLSDLIPRLRKEKELVGLAAMVMVDGKVVESAVDGERKNGSGVRLEIGDLWHLGSITKSITATMIARLIESDRLQWSTTVGECFPDAPIHADWKPVTFQELLTHTSGAPANFSVLVALSHPALGPECTAARREAVLGVLAEKPEHRPGEKFAYSNVGFTIAGAMAEKVTGQTWEDLVKRQVFEPLGLSSAGFGPPKSLDEKFPQPRGHRLFFGWKIAMDDDADNTPIIGPAGTVHMSLRDLSTFATEHLRGDLGAGKLLSAETYKRLHAPKLDQYACGWVKKEPSAEMPQTVYWHNGSNTMWYALVVFIPETKMVVAVTSNDGEVEKAEAAAWEIVKASAKQLNVEADPPRREPRPKAVSTKASSAR